MKGAPCVSILVPIYNVERYLRQCLDSVVNQTLRNIEIICINDGSTDGSLDIIKEYADQDDRIVIIDKKNSGYGDSMNQGLKKARGEFIGIVESDDWVDLDAFEKMYLLGKFNNAEVVKAEYYFNKNNTDEKCHCVIPGDAGRAINASRYIWTFVQAPAIWSAIYRRSFLEENHIDFLPTPGASYQDAAFNFKIWATAKRAYFTTEAFLHYRIDNMNSSVNSAGKVFCVCDEYEEAERYLKQQGLFEELGPTLELVKFGGYVWNMYRLNPKLLPEFIDRARAEYQKADSEGLLYRTYFAEPAQWKMLQKLLHSSTPSMARYIKRAKRKKLLRAKVKKLWIKTHPYYRKQKLIATLLDDTCPKSDLIEVRIKMLEEHHDQKASH